jgi:hypothetical protein
VACGDTASTPYFIARSDYCLLTGTTLTAQDCAGATIDDRFDQKGQPRKTRDDFFHARSVFGTQYLSTHTEST